MTLATRCPTRSPTDVLAAIPGWAEAKWEALPLGLSNQTLLVESKHAVGVLKIDDGMARGSVRSDPLPARGVEAQMQMSAATTGLAGQVLHYDDCCYLTQYVTGRVLNLLDLHETSILQALAARLRQLHSLPLSGREFNASAAITSYAANSDAANSPAAISMHAFVRNLAPLSRRVFCHNDLVAENIVATPDLLFLDWEYAADNDPLFDLAVIIEANLLTEGQAEVLLRAYCSDAGGQYWTRLNNLRKSYLAVYWFWLLQWRPADIEERESVEARFFTNCS